MPVKEVELRRLVQGFAPFIGNASHQTDPAFLERDSVAPMLGIVVAAILSLLLWALLLNIAQWAAQFLS